jgi:2-amino-4-hydroxy-6-hydroxymethyldihydropteridine diphosphokinase
MTAKHEVYLLLGSNISSRIGYLNSAKELIEKEVGKISNRSSIYESEPWGFEAEKMFLNQVVFVETSLSALDLLKKTQQIEKKLGRIRKSVVSYTSRTIDIDILFFDEAVFSLPELKIPHEQMQNRRFTLMPLVEIAAEKKHPVLHESCHQLLDECRDFGRVWKFQSTQLHEV